MNIRFPLTIIALAVLLGFFMNYRTGMTWPENLADMTGTGKVITYLGLFVVLFLWKNYRKK